jgi:hypothetical protein
MYSVPYTVHFLFCLFQTSEGEAADLSGPFAVTIRLKFLNDTERDVEANLVEKIGAFKRRNFTQATFVHRNNLSAVLDPRSEFFPSRFPDPGSKRFGIPNPIRIKELKYLFLNQKLFLNSRKYDPGCSSGSGS